MTTRYATFNAQSQTVNNRAVDLEMLSADLIPIRDAFLKLFDGVRGKGRGELHRLELGLTVTEQGKIAFVLGETRPTLTLILQSRQRSPSTRSTTSRSRTAKRPDLVEIDDPPPPESRVAVRDQSGDQEDLRSVVLDDI